MSDTDERDDRPTGGEPDGANNDPDIRPERDAANSGWIIVLKIIVGLIGLLMAGTSVVVGVLIFQEAGSALAIIAVVVQFCALIYALYRLIRARDAASIIAGAAITLLVVLLTCGACAFGSCSNQKYQREMPVATDTAVMYDTTSTSRADSASRVDTDTTRIGGDTVGRGR